ITALAFENVRLPDGTLPLLAPMSIIAGQQAILQGMQFLYNHRGGNGRSLATYPGLTPARVLVIGAGSAGLAAARIAAGIGADVTLVEICTRRIRELQPQLPENVRILHGGSHPIPSLLPQTDMLVNTATIPPDAPVHLVNRVDLPLMRQGSVIVDVTANLRGAIETVDRYTTHDDPVYEVDGIIHYVVSNIPGSVAHTSSQALAMEVFPYIFRMAELGIVAALHADETLLAGLTAVDGTLTWHEAGENLSLPWIEPAAALARIQV
ncbi:MAG: alanine dehydrogenase, partial [Lentisphaeria bacterium]|nr:alanine dehydrogenase [Lentisphaeria bacterium]